MVSLGVMLYGIAHFGLRETWPKLVLNLFYIVCLTMIGMYFFNRLKPQQFNYWCSICVGITVLLRDILFPRAIGDAIAEATKNGAFSLIGGGALLEAIEGKVLLGVAAIKGE